MTDPELVAQSLNGNRDAFGQIIARYQSLICSLAYSATGSLPQSEDLAQETFITAWKRLGHLREHDKLRAWLCGIARFLIGKALRRDGREPAHRAESLEVVAESSTAEPLPSERAISQEEAEILWRSIERIPEIYREPLVLFYREHQSITNVATALDLTEDTVKQRLSRGRKLLQAEVLAFVEGALERTNPGKMFTIGVLTALPLMTISAQAAVVGATAIKGSAAAKTAAAGGLLAAFASPLLGLFGNYVGYRMSMDMAETDEERQRIKSLYQKVFAFFVIGFVVIGGLTFWASLNQQRHSPQFIALFIGLMSLTLVACFVFTVWGIRVNRRHAAAALARGTSQTPVWEYRSQAKFLGLPLIHIRMGDRLSALKKPVTAWIAAGDIAVGGLFAFGGIAIAPFSVGGWAIGLMPYGGMALGILALGGCGIGVWVFGGFVIGWQTFGGCSIAWDSAVGGVAVAKHFALGGIAYADMANNDTARQLIEQNPFFHYINILARHVIWLNLLWIIPLVTWQQVVKRKLRLRESGNPRP